MSLSPEEMNELAKILSDPREALPLFGFVMNQAKSGITRYDPTELTYRMQRDILQYAAAPPRDDEGRVLWNVTLASRQTGKSTTAESAFYPIAAYTPGWDHVCIADTRDRGEYLHGRLQLLHSRWAREVRTETVTTNASRHLSFKNNASMRVLAGGAESAGIGQSPDSLHGSELAFWKDAGDQMSKINPSMINRSEARQILECTPATMNEPSTAWWRDQCFSAKYGKGRYRYNFYPMWDGKLNARPFKEGERLDQEELALLNKYGPLGMRPENLMFRRMIIDTDQQIRRDPALFEVYYPFDDIKCWAMSAGGVLARSVVEKRRHEIEPWDKKDYQEFEGPRPNCIYVLNADPSGYGHDHAAFVVLKVWADEWEQVATYGGPADPNEFYQLVHATARKYNAFVSFERNGVGLALVTGLHALGYRRIVYDDKSKPGYAKSSHDQWLSWVQDGLLDRLTLRCERTMDQVNTYRNGKLVEKSSDAMLKNDKNPGGLDRAHYDIFSALVGACWAARRVPVRIKPQPEKVLEVKASEDWTWNDIDRYARAVTDLRKPRTRKRFTPRWRR